MRVCASLIACIIFVDLLQLGLKWSGKKGVKPAGSVEWPDDTMLPQLMTAAAASGGHWRKRCVRMKDKRARPLNFADCITERVSMWVYVFNVIYTLYIYICIYIISKTIKINQK